MDVLSNSERFTDQSLPQFKKTVAGHKSLFYRTERALGRAVDKLTSLSSMTRGLDKNSAGSEAMNSAKRLVQLEKENRTILENRTDVIGHEALKRVIITASNSSRLESLLEDASACRKSEREVSSKVQELMKEKPKYVDDSFYLRNIVFQFLQEEDDDDNARRKGSNDIQTVKAALSNLSTNCTAKSSHETHKLKLVAKSKKERKPSQRKFDRLKSRAESSSRELDYLLGVVHWCNETSCERLERIDGQLSTLRTFLPADL